MTSANVKITALERSFDALYKDAASANQLLRILNTYGNSLRQWKNGLMMMKEPDADMEWVQKMFKLGDTFRVEACQEFDRRYASQKPAPSS